jgi:hypothetical protein
MIRDALWTFTITQMMVTTCVYPIAVITDQHRRAVAVVVVAVVAVAVVVVVEDAVRKTAAITYSNTTSLCLEERFPE